MTKLSAEQLKEYVRLRATVGTAPISEFREADRSFGVRYAPTITLAMADFDAIFEQLSEISQLKSQLNTATELLHGCLEWDNGGERDYEAIVAFLNEQQL